VLFPGSLTLKLTPLYQYNSVYNEAGLDLPH
jgi:hypothetical protein